MTFEEAYNKIREEAISPGELDEIRKLNTKRQMKKFVKGWGRVRELAGLPHGRAVLGR